MKIDEEILTSGNIDIEEKKFYCHSAPICLKDVVIKKVLVPNKILFGEKNYKCLIGQLYNDV